MPGDDLTVGRVAFGPRGPRPGGEAARTLGSIARREAMGRAAVDDFVRAILHGGPSHRAWLLAAAEAFKRGDPIPAEVHLSVGAPQAMPDVAGWLHVASGRPYMVERVVLQTETEALEVVYVPLYAADLPEGVTGFARPLEMFMDGRFRRIR